MDIDTDIRSVTQHGLVLSVTNMDAGLLVAVPLGETKIGNVDLFALLPCREV